MQRLPALLLAICLACCAISSAQEQPASNKVVRAKFVVQLGHYPGVTVEFISGRIPELFLYNAADKEMQKMFVHKLTFDDLAALMLAHGFAHLPRPGGSSGPMGHEGRHLRPSRIIGRHQRHGGVQAGVRLKRMLE